ncbi:hypothetical protein J4E81_001959 [Alternaria sp. BMP 2799]|nr:hypothetical protein J4E81_001959 [Alternaria sp. BMP 2799]
MLAAAQQYSQLPASTSTNGKSLGLGIGAWPAPAPRSTGYPRDLVRGSGSPSPPADPVSENVQISRPKLDATKPVARVAGPPKGTMELMSVPYQRRPETSVQSKASTRSGSPVKSQLSAWELRMEKAMAEDAPATTAKASTRPQASRKKSIPPHLRSKPDEIIKAAHQKPVTLSLNPNAKVYEVAAKQEETVQDDVDILEDSIVALQVAMDIPGIQNSKDGLRVQQELLDRYIVNNQLPPPPPTATTITAAAATTVTDRVHVDHETKVKVLLIRAMEHEMDLEKVAPERELMVMQRAELDSYCNKVSSAHKHWWQAMGPA